MLDKTLILLNFFIYSLKKPFTINFIFEVVTFLLEKKIKRFPSISALETGDTKMSLYFRGF